MRIPSKQSFQALGMDISESEWAALEYHMGEEYTNEHAAHLVLTAMRNGTPLVTLRTVGNSGLERYEEFKELMSHVAPDVEESVVQSFFWSIPLSYADEDRIYLTSAFLSYGESFSSLLVSFRSSNNANLPESVPVSWFAKFFDGERQLREEGIVLSSEISMILFGYWTFAEVVDFLVRKVDLREVSKFSSYGITDAEEITDMSELLPSEWLDDFFS